VAGLVGLLWTAPSSGAEPGAERPAAEAHLEVPDDPYVPAPREEQPRSPATRFGTGTFFAVQVNVDALGQNIVGDAANEPSLAVDPTDLDNMVIGWRQFDTISSNFRQAGYGWTTDGGQTWTFPGVIEPGVFRSDPVLGADSGGRIHYNSLTLDGNDYLCDVFRSTEGGMSWDEGVPAYGGDKQWMTVDTSGGAGDGHVYASWNSFFTSCSPGFFTRSLDGDSYEPCLEVPDSPYWGTLAVGPDGELFVIGVSGSTSGFVVNRSSNAKLGLGQALVWDLTTGLSLGGQIESGVGPNPGGLLGQAWIATDPGSGPSATVYALCSVDPPGSDPLDVRFSRSTDGGASWSPSVRVNDDLGTAWQWFGTMSVAPTGRIDAVWLDTRNDPGGYDSSLYYSFSTDGGTTWSDDERLSDAFDPHLGWPQQNKMGDYFHMVSDEQGFRLAWAATFNGEQDVYFGRKIVGAVAADEGPDARAVTLLRSDPNPFRESATIRYRVPQDGYVTLRVYDALGRRVATLVKGERTAGTHEVRLDGRNLPSGVYFYHLDAAGVRETKKVLRVK
jgi:hypothetical protein